MVKKILLLVCVGVISLSVSAASIMEKDTRLHALWANGEYATALPLAQDIITGISSKYGEESSYLIPSYHNKAIINRELHDYAESKRSFSESIRIAKSNFGPYNHVLIGVLIDFGVLYYEMGEDKKAIDKFQEAQHIAHRNDGVYTLTQLTAMDWVSATVKRSGAIKKADVQEKFYYKVNEKNYPYGDLRILPATKRLGEWLKNTGQYGAAMKLNKNALVMIQSSEEATGYHMIPILREISSIAYLSGKCCRDKPLEQVITVMETGGGVDVEELIKATLHLADMKTLSRKIPEAGKLYKKAWNLRFGTPNAEKSSLEEFGFPIQLGYSDVVDGVTAFQETRSQRYKSTNVKTYYPQKEGRGSGFSFNPTPLRQRMIGAPMLMCFLQVREILPYKGSDKLDTYYVDLGFSVKQTGAVSKVKITDSNAPPKLKKYVKNLFSKLKYRPKIENGTPVLSKVTVRQTFNDANIYDMKNSFVFPERITGAEQVCRLLATQ